MSRHIDALVFVLTLGSSQSLRLNAFFFLTSFLFMLPLQISLLEKMLGSLPAHAFNGNGEKEPWSSRGVKAPCWEVALV